ncbi:hypothetical protein POM88_037987 [Heracleum sosnowskyi]|uniref:Uncharacterized protein n=1 Tax=Heracleum sosnowskyi TaxID=360622 RepID=A0AAD8MDS2_9APIA|nr:hypothetical protein POM88_037987 [Heracleum sosnowskyi]
MGRNGSYNQIHHHRNLSASSTTTNSTTSTATTTTFLPLLCRTSMKDVAETSSCHKKNEPSSPKVSCMGQIKRHNNNNKINPTTHTTAKIRYTQLKKIFSGRNLLITTYTNTSTCARTTYCKDCRGCQPKSHVEDIKKKSCTRPKKEGGEHRRTESDNCGVVVPLNLAELDPPLPVLKLACRRRGEEEGGSLWKRRGGASRGLQIQPIQLPNNNSCLLITPPSVS